METLDVIENQPRAARRGARGSAPSAAARSSAPCREQREIKEVMVFLQSHGVSTGLRGQDLQALRRGGDGGGAREPLPPGGRRLRHRLQDAPTGSPPRWASPQDAPQRVEAGAAPPAGRGGRPRPPLPAAGGARWRRPRRCSASSAARGRGGARDARRRRRGRWSSRCAGRTPAERAVYLTALHAAERGIAERVRALLAAAGRCRWRSTSSAPSPGSRSARGSRSPREQREAIRLGLHAQGAGHHRRPGHRQDDAGARHRRDPGAEGAARRCSPRPPAARPSAWPRPPAREADDPPPAARVRTPRRRGFERNRDHPLDGDLADRRRGLDARRAARLPPPARGAGRRAGWCWWATSTSCRRSAPAGCSPTSSAPGAVEVVRLTEIFRQAERSLIVVNAHRVNQRRDADPRAPADEATATSSSSSGGRPRRSLETMRELVARAHPGSASASIRSSRSRC